MSGSLWSWAAATALIAVLLVVDLRVNGRGRQLTMARAAVATGLWIGVGLGFGAVYGAFHGGAVTEQYFTAYLLEKSLSLDNVFVFALLFEALAVPEPHRRRVLYFGVVGALVLRAVFISGGAALLDRLSWTLYVLGAVVLAAGIHMALSREQPDPGRSAALRFARRVIPVTEGYEGDRFFVRRGTLVATPLLLALVAVETSDIVFAADSIPAVFGVTRDAFVVFTSNAFAVLGLRSLYFVLAGALERLRYLRQGLAVILVFIGAKMLLEPFVHVPDLLSLAVLAAIVAAATLLSLRAPDEKAAVRNATAPGTRARPEAAAAATTPDWRCTG